MRITLPYGFKFSGTVGRSQTVRDYAVHALEEVEIAEVDKEDFPVAVSWEHKASYEDDIDLKMHTCFAGGSHWRPLLNPEGAAFDLCGDPVQVMTTITTRMPDWNRINIRLATDFAAGENLHVGHRLISEDKLDDDLSENAQRSRQLARFDLHSFANSLILCEGHLYHRTGEPIIVAARVSEKRPPDTLIFMVEDSKKPGFINRRKVQTVYSHRIDRLDDFRDLMAEQPAHGGLDILDLVETVVVHKPEAMTFDDEAASVDELVRLVRDGLRNIPTATIRMGAAELCRKLEDVTGKDRSSALGLITDNLQLFEGRGFETLKSEIKSVSTRWQYRPIVSMGL